VIVENGNNINWMAAKGWLKDGERKLLFELASQLPGNAEILNIGVEYGASLACLRAGNPTASIYGIDLDCSKAVSAYDCELVQFDSHEIVKFWNDPIDLIFVDGDHGELGVSLDAKFADFLPEGGMILFQDCYDWDKPGEIHGVCPGVNAAVEKWSLREDIKQEFEELPSVDTTRIFRRVSVKEHEQPTDLAGSSRADTDLQPGGTVKSQPAAPGPASQVRGGGKGPGQRR
jgi:hypothetical protein